MTDDLGKLILRLMLGILMLFHGYAKIVKGVGGIEVMVASAGLPAWVAYGVYIGEVLAPLLVIIGFYTRIGALIMAVNMIVAIFLAHQGQFFDTSRTGGWALELQGFFLFSAIAIALIGPGRYSINRR